MQEIFKILIGVAVLILGIPIGNILAKHTHEELRGGRKWFILLIVICFIGAILNLIFSNDALLFTFLFIAVVTSRSLKKRDVNVKDKKRK
jgi:uncharacterized membrane protein YhaH (DUF805 family)